MKKVVAVIFLSCVAFTPFAQQIADTTYNPPILQPEYSQGQGPVVFIDEGHHNFHTKDGRYWAFANLLERDGYVIKKYEGPFKKRKLENGKILVISNALNEKNVENWYVPTFSAFTPDEIAMVKQWVLEGGNLFLIADHMPMAGAAKELAAAFHFQFTNGFVLDTVSGGPAIFNRENKTLVESKITNGRNDSEKVDEVASFTGQGFKLPVDATPILIFEKNHVNFLPDTAWVFSNDTPRENMKGWSQGAFKKYGKGRVVMWGEAAMFTAQLAGPDKIKAGMNTDIAKENYQLLLNIVHWLDGRLE